LDISSGLDSSDISLFIGNSKARVKRSNEDSAACPSYSSEGILKNRGLFFLSAMRRILQFLKRNRSIAKNEFMHLRRWKYTLGISLVVIGIVIAWQPWLNRLSVIREGGKGPPTLVLLHGYASSADKWIPFSQSIPLPPNGRFLFPQAPERTRRTDGGPDGRAWWEMDLANYLRPGRDGIDLTEEDPQGLKQAARKVRSLLSTEGNSAKHPFILGGFSQGAMVACQIAFLSDEPLSALVILSGTPINEKTWRSQMGRRKGLPVFMSHGRSDTILPIDLAERLRAEMVNAGMSVTFVPFEGNHEIPAEVVVALNEFLSKINK
jgi:phospholipase/carboxylesterase